MTYKINNTESERDITAIIMSSLKTGVCLPALRAEQTSPIEGATAGRYNSEH